MFGKLLLTLSIIAAAYGYIRYRARTRVPSKTEPDNGVVKGLTPRQMAYVVLGILAVATAVMTTLHWQEQHEVLTVRVTNTRTGEIASYQARRGDLKGRSFETLDGRRVTIADVERIETLETH